MCIGPHIRELTPDMQKTVSRIQNKRPRGFIEDRTRFVCKLDGVKDSFSEMFTELSGREEIISNAEKGDVVNGMHCISCPCCSRRDSANGVGSESSKLRDHKGAADRVGTWVPCLT